MSWITLTEAKFLEQCTGPETSAIKTAALASGQTEPLSATIAKTVQTVRGYVAAYSRNALGEGVTIPQELEAAAVAIVRFTALNRLPSKSLLTETRVIEYRDALTLLRDVAAGRFMVEQPATPSEQVIESGGSVQVVTKTKRQATRAKLKGL